VRERTSPGGQRYTAPADDCCPERTLWLLGSLMQYVSDSRAKNQAHDDLEPDIRRLGSALQRQLAGDPERFEQAKGSVLSHNRSAGQWFDLNRVLRQVSLARRSP
jgi:hypothetical protein